MATAGAINVEVRADFNPAMETIELAIEQFDSLYYLPYSRREQFVMWVARQLGVRMSVRRTPRGGLI